MTSLNVVYLLMGAGIGLCIGFMLGLSKRPKVPTQKVESTIYFGRDEHDHPDDIERQEGSAFVPAPGVGAFVGRGYDHRYDGIADARRKG